MWGLPLFDIKDPAAVLFELNMCIKAKPNYYVKLACFDNTRGTESCVLAFIVNRPSFEPGFKMVRQESAGRQLVYTIESYAVDTKPVIFGSILLAFRSGRLRRLTFSL
jgi:ribulose-bisphosphate carboxylase small chain